MFLWINFALWCFIMFFTGLVFSMAFEPRRKRPRWILALIFFLVNLPEAYLKITHTGELLAEIMYWLCVVIAVLYLIIIFKDNIWKKILFYVLWTTITFVGDIICYSLMRYSDLDFDVSFNSMRMVLFVALDVIIVMMLSILLLITWNRVINYKKLTRNIWLFFVFPISQLITLYFMNGRAYSGITYNDIYVCIGVLLGFVADFILLYVLMEQGVKEEMEKRLQEMELLYQIENIHYQSIEAKRTEMAKLRHDFNNQLLAAYHMTEQGNSKQSRILIDALRDEIAKTKEYTYCGNPIINAVMEEKSSVCEQQNIRLETSIEVGEEEHIQPVHICSVFTNLIDNAIHATGSCPENERFIEVKAARVEDYLYIKVNNSSSEPKKQRSQERKGYGHEILKDIALRYKGEFQTDWHAGVYTAMLALTIR